MLTEDARTTHHLTPGRLVRQWLAPCVVDRRAA
jgi:hypothetical protein